MIDLSDGEVCAAVPALSSDDYPCLSVAKKRRFCGMQEDGMGGEGQIDRRGRREPIYLIEATRQEVSAKC